ncbi:MAG TPA: PD-(D/E)XK nuclease family protein, partial [Candidatus Saccharimonadales bacterium]|nr:PD-(D/E)XK nuclease family protein [Candidatus Saccharimonadales bacterium]
IAILAPKHRYLEPILPYLAQQKLPVRYERRENILDEPLLHQLEQMSRLVIALSDGDELQADSLWPEVLSYNFWRVPVEQIWKIGWRTKSAREPWTGALLNEPALADVAGFFLSLQKALPISTLEEQLDGLIGHGGSAEKFNLPISSPLFEYYFGPKAAEADSMEYAELINELNILRSNLREWRRGGQGPLGLRDFVEFIEGHRAAGLNILNTSPYHESADAVNLLTAYGAKGREFQAVFVVSAIDEVWGSASRNQGYRLSLPANLTYIRYQGASEDERLRLMFVAATRARTRLYFTGYQQTLAGKPMNRLKYLDISEDEGKLISRVLPESFNEIIEDKTDSLSLKTARSYWTDRHQPPFKRDLKSVLAPQLQRYQLSATHLNHFLDILNAGPSSFFLECILCFPSAPDRTTVYGTAMHNTLRWAGGILTREGQMPTENRLAEILAVQLGRVDLRSEDFNSLLQRGQLALHEWLKQSGKKLKATDRFEYDFKDEGVFCGEAHLSGKLDRIVVDEKRHRVTVVDYKTGQSYKRWQSSVVKLHKFRQQLMVYKLLIEGSNRFKNYQVEKGVIEFIEPDADGRINRLELLYNDTEMEEIKKLINAVWSHIQQLDLPDTSGYPLNISGIRTFEKDLIKQLNTPAK